MILLLFKGDVLYIWVKSRNEKKKHVGCYGHKIGYYYSYFIQFLRKNFSVIINQ